MKYRIKVQINANGDKIYYPQYKKFLFWNDFIREVIDLQYIYTDKKLNSISFYNLDYAKNFIAKKKAYSNYTCKYLKM